MALTLEILHHADRSDVYSIMGGDRTNPTWEEYTSRIEPGYRLHFELIKDAIENPANGLYRITGEQKQNMGITFKFSDDEHWSFSWRAWGDLMQAIVNKREGYMAYYM